MKYFITMIILKLLSIAILIVILIKLCLFLDAGLLKFNYATVLITVFTSWIWNDRRA